MKNRRSKQFSLRLYRFVSGLLCAVMLCGLLPADIALIGRAQAAEAELSWSEEDLETLRTYDIMRGYDDGSMHPERTITRAEFAAMINRALGYSEKAAKLPFKDVAVTDWFADDISVSYNMGYLNGTTNTTMAPTGTLTRQEALVILSRNLMLQPAVGESFGFADSRSFADWSRGYIDPAIEAGVIDADRTGNFSPQKSITRGEVAGMLVRAIGTPIQHSGVVSLGNVDGNVTITASGVTLRNTTINGDLYLTGGIGLGDVWLDNVTVNGKIIDSGAGQSEKGEISVTLNNVDANELIVDSMRNQTISLCVRGSTSIPKTSVRTPAYLDDSTSADYGLAVIEIDGEEKTAVRLSGNIKEVHNKTRSSSLNIGEGVAEKVTIDEAAAGSTLTLGKDARIKELNLDAGAKVDGGGYIDKLTVSANGATVAQLPDEIVVAPGITATINKTKMDSAAAIEASSWPRMASGYPVTDNEAPTSATGLFKANKPGTIYWAVTALADGSPSEDEIIAPPSYAKTILKHGSINVKESNKEYTAKISGLTSDGSYYLSAIMVDSRGTRSPIKVYAFSTPDSTTPGFAKGYPVEHEISEQNAQFAVMTTKSCNLYYALLPKGSTAPRAADFKSGSISGNLGYGVVKMSKNNPAYIFVNDVSLEEQQSYVLYLWLNDFDGAKSSAVKSINFTTQDKTNPIVSNMRQTDTKASAATMSYILSEQGTLYWAAVAAGNETFMSPSSNTTTNVPFLETLEAKERIVSGVGALKKGTSNVAAAKAGENVGFSVSGLNTKTTGTSAYDLYYVAKDKAGNWSDRVQKVTIYTLDTTAPKAALEFTSFNEGEDETTKEPLADTDIKIVFSKAVRVVDKDNSGVTIEYPFLDLYQQGKRDQLAKALREHVLLYKVPSSGSPVLAQDEVKDPVNWDINYSMARVYMDGTDMVVEFPYNADSTQSAHHLANGGSYYFELSGIQDTTSNHNPMAKTKLEFKTKQAQVNISSPGISELTYGDDTLAVDFSFQLDPKATSSSPDGIYYDILLWCDKSITFDLYRREGADGEWKPVGTPNGKIGLFQYTISAGSKEMYQTINQIMKTGNSYPYDELKELDEEVSYQYAVHIVTMGSSNGNRETWNLTCNIGVSVASGQKGDLNNLAGGNGTLATWETQKNGRINSIGNPDPYSRQVTISDSVAPVLSGVYPTFDPLDTTATMRLMLDRPGTIYYVVTPVTENYDGSFSNPVPPTFVDTTIGDNSDPNTNRVWTSGKEVNHTLGEKSTEIYLSMPDRDGIISKRISDPTVRQGSIVNDGDSTCTVELNDLQAETWYYVYLMFQGNRTSEQAVCYKFKTTPPIRPILSLSVDNKTDASVDATVTQSGGAVTARLIPTSDLSNTIFGQPFNGGTTGKGEGNYVLNDGSDYLNTTKSFADNYTILQAMMDSVGSTGTRSVFDEYASTALQNYVANEIKSGSVGGVTKWGNPTTIKKDTTTTMTFSLPNPNVRYFCVAVAENLTPGGEHGFRGISPVQIVDNKEPTADKLSGALILNEEMTEDGKTRTYTYTLEGTLTVQYANFLYRFDSTSQQALPFTQAGQLNGSDSDPKGPFWYPDGSGTQWYGVSGLYNAGSNVTVQTTGGAPQLTREFTIQVKIDLGQRKVTAKEETVLDSDGNVVLENGKPVTITTWPEPTKPTTSGSISLPTDFVNRSNIPASVSKNITYKVDKNGNVTVSLSR